MCYAVYVTPDLHYVVIMMIIRNGGGGGDGDGDCDGDCDWNGLGPVSSNNT